MEFLLLLLRSLGPLILLVVVIDSLIYVTFINIDHITSFIGNHAQTIVLMVGIPLGILSSFVAWWILFHVLVPKLTFSPSISKVTAEDRTSGYRYRVRIMNTGQRSVIDIWLRARLSVGGMRPNLQSNWTIAYIPLGNRRIPRIQKNKSIIITLRVERLKPPTIFPDEIKDKCADETILLDDVMKLGKEAKLQLFAFGYDEFSGARRLFESKEYRVDNITEDFQTCGMGEGICKLASSRMKMLSRRPVCKQQKYLSSIKVFYLRSCAAVNCLKRSAGT